MAGVMQESWEVYKEKINLVIIFSIPFLIAFAIPLLAPLPTYITSGAIFLRSASIFVNGNVDVLSIAVITIATLFSLLFLSFAFVMISILVKSKRTHSSVGKMVFKNIESNIAKVFAIFLIYTVALIVVNVLGYFVGLSTLLTALVGFFLFAFLFYAPSSVVVDDKKVSRAIKDSARLVVHGPQHFILWMVLITVILSVLDLVCMPLGTPWSSYMVLIISSLFVVPYFVIFQAEAYMDTFKLLKH